MEKNAAGKGGQAWGEDTGLYMARMTWSKELMRNLADTEKEHLRHRNSQCKGPEVETGLVCVRNNLTQLELNESGESHRRLGQGEFSRPF